MRPSTNSFYEKFVPDFIKKLSDSSQRKESPDARKSLSKPQPVPPRLTPHLESVRKNLSMRHATEEVAVAVELLRILKLDAGACEQLGQCGVIDDILDAMSREELTFQDVLSGPAKVLIPIFEHLVAVDAHAAKRFVRVCNEKVQPLIVETAAYQCMQALIQSNSKEIDKEAKRETDMFIATVTQKIADGPDVCAKQLERFVRGCPESARKELAELLTSSVVTQACKQSPGLTAAVGEFQQPVEWNEAELEVSMLALEISNATSPPGLARAGGPERLADDRINSLYRKIEDRLSQGLNLRDLLAKLCPGNQTKEPQAKFVAGLLGRLVKQAHQQGKPFDYRNFFSMALLSGMPGNMAKHLAGAAVQAIATAEEAGELIEGLKSVIGEAGMEIGHLHALQRLAAVIAHHVQNAKHLDEALRAAGSWPKLESVLAGIETETTKKIQTLAALSNHPDELLRDKERSAKVAEDASRVLAAREVEAAVDLVARPGSYKTLPEVARQFAAKVASGQLDIGHVVEELSRQYEIDKGQAAIGKQHADTFLGIVAAKLLVSGRQDLFDRMLQAYFECVVQRGKGAQIGCLRRVADGLVSGWYDSMFFRQFDAKEAHAFVSGILGVGKMSVLTTGLQKEFRDGIRAQAKDLLGRARDRALRDALNKVLSEVPAN